MDNRNNNDRSGNSSDGCRERQVQINNSIAQHGKRKELDEAMALFREALQLNCDNSHTYAAIINANIRCGKLAAASDIYKQMLKKGRKKDVIICTTLLKGYCLMEDMLNAVELYVSMISNKPTAIIPNIRTINTLLRGCIFIGEVGLCEMLTATAQREQKLQLDVTSWEYLMTLLTQSLQLDKAMPILGRLKAMLTHSEEEGDGCSSSNTLLSVHVNTARAAAMLGDWKLCNKLCVAARGGGGGVMMMTRNIDQPTTTDDRVGAVEEKKKKKKKGIETTAAKVIGGKRAWHSSANDDDDCDDRRMESLRLYQEHTSAELLEEVGLIDRFRLQQMQMGGGGGAISSSSSSSIAQFDYMFPFFLKLFPFSKDYLSFSADQCDSTSTAPPTTTTTTNNNNRGGVVGPAATGNNKAIATISSSSSSSSATMMDLSALSEKDRRRVIKKSVVKSIIYRVEESFGLGVFSRRLCGQSCDQIAGYSVGTPSYLKVLSAATDAAAAAKKTGRSKGGGSQAKKSKKNPPEQQQQLPHDTTTTVAAVADTAATVTTESSSSGKQHPPPPRSPMELRIASYRALVAKSFDSSGRLNFDSIYSGSSPAADAADDKGVDKARAVTRGTDAVTRDTGRPLKLEICSGAGEWAVAQARDDVHSNWITLELRYDRAYQTFSKAVFAGIHNLCVLCGDAMTIIPTHMPSSVLDNVFVNHPEPPQQVAGKGGSTQGNHLLDESFFLEMTRVLKPNGMLTIVTDNLWYGKLLIRLVAAIISSSSSSSSSSGENRADADDDRVISSHQLQCASIDRSSSSSGSSQSRKRSGMQKEGCSDTTTTSSKDSDSEDCWRVQDTAGGVHLFVGRPGPDAGHVVDASSYFDRLWKRGNVSDRYFIVLRKKEKRKKSSDHQQQQQQHTLKQRPFSATGGAASSAAAAAASKMLVSKGTKSERGKKKYFD